MWHNKHSMYPVHICALMHKQFQTSISHTQLLPLRVKHFSVHTDSSVGVRSSAKTHTAHRVDRSVHNRNQEMCDGQRENYESGKNGQNDGRNRGKKQQVLSIEPLSFRSTLISVCWIADFNGCWRWSGHIYTYSFSASKSKTLLCYFNIDSALVYV